MSHREYPAAGREKTFFGHPRGLAVLFGTEMWERFSFYGLQGILLTFLTASVLQNGLGLSDTVAVPIASLYSGAVYLTSLPGGWLADRVLGARRAVLIGGVIIMCGHISMAIPVEGPGLVFFGLFLVVLGSGLLKPNISVMVGRLYDGDSDARRDSGFSVFYMGINLGGFLGILVTPYLAGDDRWHLGFGAAAVGMALGLLWYVRGWSRLTNTGIGPSRPLEGAERGKVVRVVVIALVATAVAVAIWAATGTLTLSTVPTVVTVLSIVAAVWYFVYIFGQAKDVTPAEKSGLRAYVGLFIASVVFWMLYLQMGSILTAFASNSVDLDSWGFHLPAGGVQNFNSIFILIFSPIFGAIWLKTGTGFGTAYKFALGVGLTGLSWVFLGWLQGRADGGVLVALGWMVVVYLLLTWGELCVSPVGLSVTTQLAPSTLKGQLMGVWFLGPAVGTPLGGQAYAFLVPRVGEQAFFYILAGLAILTAVVLALFSPALHRLMGQGGHGPDAVMETPPEPRPR
ncbi:proton-dependent oligopeptide transporter, POT family [Glycomyces sambucus]|uniref:Proton-dependent oligopeptide transporter, POT family n=1 Tax=Glycomyces sambucus TaxID=380244 RepID=A0A1G9J8X9_9ACTN|nr:oligopeptide:H+ symporter [Glycomyces sambucus]SDL34010.1 proton-dependent oligopeptide transporter, POT family [Glycomyces sambucus]